MKATKGAAGTININVANADKEQAVGNKVNLIAVSEVYGLMADASVTIVDEGVVAGLSFDSENGVADKVNTIGYSVVDEEGNAVANVTADDTYIYVADQSDKDANIEVKATKDIVNGKNGAITIYSDKETTVDVVVAVKDDDSDAIYADTLTYTIGAADVNADKIVAMTIGSTDMIVDNAIVSGDAAPYIADGRTMVPIRALSETFGAEVDFKDNVVTIVDGDTTIVMTIGETTYTINDEEQTMDVAPVIGSGDRTYVPIRFVAEALGYKVTPLYAADGTTASVVFQK